MRLEHKVLVKKIIETGRTRRPRKSWLKKIKDLGEERGKVMGEMKVLD